MKIYVASYFFPPNTSSEGLVTYKLLRNSVHEYYVCSALTNNWSYNSVTEINNEKNIHVYGVKTDSVDEWVDACIDKFFELDKEIDFDCFMTRSMPPESIIVGKAIKEKRPDLKWIASFADPIANNPYEIKAYIDENQALSLAEKIKLKEDLRSNDESLLEKWEAMGGPLQLMCKLRRWENYTKKTADLIISPSSRQLKYMLGNDHWLPKFMVVPHSYDTSFYKKTEAPKEKDDSKVEFIYTGYSDKLRTLFPLIKAVRMLKENDNPAVEKVHFTIVGNTPTEIRHAVLNYYLDDYFTFVSGVDYYESLNMVSEADWAVHVDAFFGDLYPGGSIFFAGKIADYIGAGIPILAITGEGSPAHELVTQSGGLVCNQFDITKLALIIEQIANHDVETHYDKERVEGLNSKCVARKFDDRVTELCGTTYKSKRTNWPQLEKSLDEKTLSVCVPSYNAQVFLDRCLYTLINHDMAPYMEVLVVNDGSKDLTPLIAAEYEKKYPGIVRLINKENGGHGSTINRAIKEATGKYFKNVDSDDWVDSSNLSKLIKYLQENGEIDAISSDYDEVDLETGAETPMRAGKSIEYGKIYNFSSVDPEDCYFTIHSLTIRTQLLRDMNMKLQHHTFFVDCEYILFPVPYIKSFVFLPDKVYKYSRGNPDQSVDVANMVRRFDHHDRVVKRCLEYRNSVSMGAGEKAYYDAVMKRILNTHFALSLLYDTDKRRGMHRAKEFYAFLSEVRPDLSKWAVKNINFLTIPYRSGFNSQAVNLIDKSKAIAVKTKNKLKRIALKIRYS